MDCNECGQKDLGSYGSYYRLDFSILPTKLRSKHKKNRQESIFYCLGCYEKIDRLTYMVNNNECFLEKVAVYQPKDMMCPVCIKSVEEMINGRLYGLITTSFVCDGNIQSNFVATICGDCLKTNTFELKVW
jgi:hypothetical protein